MSHHTSEYLSVVESVGRSPHMDKGLRLPGQSQSQAKSREQRYHSLSRAVQDSHLDKGCIENYSTRTVIYAPMHSVCRQILLHCNGIMYALIRNIPCRSVILILNMNCSSMFENSCSLCSKGRVSRLVRVSGDSLLLVSTVTTTSLELFSDNTSEYTVAVMFPSTGRGWSLTAYSLNYMVEMKHNHHTPNTLASHTRKYRNCTQQFNSLLVQCWPHYSLCFLPLKSRCEIGQCLQDGWHIL